MGNIYGEIQNIIREGHCACIQTTFEGVGGVINKCLVKKLVSAANHLSVKPLMQSDDKKTCFLEPIARKDRLIILGGGHIALPLSEFAFKTGFNVVVVDDRMDFANKIRFPWASEVMCDSFERAISKIKIRESDYVTIITRGHRYDAVCLKNILKESKPYYLGMIGSKRRVKGLFEMLEEEGFNREELDKICTPIGLSINAVLPEEIAVSILAELILYRRKNNSNITSDLDLTVIDYIASVKEPAAIITVMDTKGSTPRGAGAKMTVNKYGKIHGSIGGGCAEKDIINKAIRIIGTGRYQVEEIDLNGDVAESEGMVCGGIMKVLIEDLI